MKIYNKIVLEWNEETQKYDKVVEEDSFDYEGELILGIGLMAIAGLAKGAFDIYSASKNKPKWKDYEPSRKYLDKYTASLRGRGEETYRAHMQPQLRQIGSVSRKMARERRYAAAKSGLEGSGIVAQERLSAGANILEGIQKASEQASIKRTEQQERSREAIASATMKHEQDVDVARRQFGMAEKQHGAQMRQAVGSLAFSAATTGIGHMQKVGGLKASLGADKYQALRDKGYSIDQLSKIASGLQTQEIGLISTEYSAKDYLQSLIDKDTAPSGKTTTGDQPPQITDTAQVEDMPGIGPREGAFGTVDKLGGGKGDQFKLETPDISLKEPPPKYMPEPVRPEIVDVDTDQEELIDDLEITPTDVPDPPPNMTLIHPSWKSRQKQGEFDVEEWQAEWLAKGAEAEKLAKEKRKNEILPGFQKSAGSNVGKGLVWPGTVTPRSEALGQVTGYLPEGEYPPGLSGEPKSKRHKLFLERERANYDLKRKRALRVKNSEAVDDEANTWDAEDQALTDQEELIDDPEITPTEALRVKKAEAEALRVKKAEAAKAGKVRDAKLELKKKKQVLKGKRDQAYKSGKQSIRKAEDGTYRFKFIGPDGSYKWMRSFNSKDEAISHLGKLIGSAYK